MSRKNLIVREEKSDHECGVKNSISVPGDILSVEQQERGT